MVLSLRQLTRGERARAAQDAQRITRWATNDDTLPELSSAAGRSRRRLRREALGRATAALMLASAVMAVASVPVAIADGPGDRGGQSGPTQRPAYFLVDPGTFGGPLNFLDLPGIPVTDAGVMLGTADTTIADTDYPNFNPFMVSFPDPVLTQAFKWRDGRLINLGALPGNNSSAVFEVNGRGVGAGMSENGLVDPNTGWPAVNAVVFTDGRVINLGTLPGGYESQAGAINDRGDVAGFASNGTADAFSIFGWGTQTRSFFWHDGVMRDIGTLGGPDSVVTTLNARGQVAGQSYTNSTPNPSTGTPTTDPFLWQRGRLQDLGTLGGTQSATNWLNDRGQVVGQSNLAGDQTHHPFLWDGKRLQDLGTLGGDNGNANWVNDEGDVVGSADLPSSQAHDGFLWTNGRMRDLRPVSGSPCSNAFAINNSGVAVGNTTDCHGNSIAAIVWQHGTATDLNTLITSTGTHLTDAEYISDQGEIVGHAVLANGATHVFLLIPRTRCAARQAALQFSGRGSDCGLPLTPVASAWTTR
jgi:probable HAF family extracellular repeat protein